MAAMVAANKASTASGGRPHTADGGRRMLLWQVRVDVPTLHEEGDGRVGTCTREEEEGREEWQGKMYITII